MTQKSETEGVYIDKAKARQILEREAKEARGIEPGGAWYERVSRLGELAVNSKTMIAMLGTAILAKATDQRVDVFSLQASAGERAYSARSLCKDVLAAEAKRLSIDLGVSGREPLNNQPFFGKPRVTLDLNVKSNARQALAYLVESLALLDKVQTQKEADRVLRAFIQARESKKVRVVVDEGAGSNLEERDLILLIRKFVRADGENGKRAQAVVAGLLDAMVGESRVRTARINDPSRGVPGDVAVLEPGSKVIERTFEVRDKPITEADLLHFVERARADGVFKVGMVAVADQGSIDVSEAVRSAEARQVRLGVYLGWERFVQEALFWSQLPAIAIGPAYRAILTRAEELEVSQNGLALWLSASPKESLP